MCTLGNSYAQLFLDGISMCCPAWNSGGIIPLNGRTYKEAWESEDFCKIYCFDSCPRKKAEGIWYSSNRKLRRVMIAFDETCNIRCQTCRNCIIRTDPVEISKRLLDLEQSFGNTLQALELCGSGDPIASPTIRKWLSSLTEEQFPQLNQIYLQTNGLLFNRSFWNGLSPFVKTRLSKVIVSIDAACQEPYEKIRRGGKWDTLQKSLKFISSLPEIPNLAFCFVVQRDNYKEIVDFYDMCKGFAGNKPFEVLYQQVQLWGDRISEKEFERQNIFASTDQEELQELGRQLREVRKRRGTLLQITDMPQVPLNKLKLV